MSADEVREYRPRRGRLLLMALVTPLGLAFGLFIVLVDANAFSLVGGGIIVVVCTLAFLCGLLLLVPGTAYLRLTPAGITYRWLRPPVFVPWPDVDEVACVKRGDLRQVIVTLKPHYRPPAWLRRLGMALSKRQWVLAPEPFFAVRSEELADLLNRYKDRFACDRSNLIVRLPVSGPWGTADQWHRYDDLEQNLNTFLTQAGWGSVIGSDRAGDHNDILVEDVKDRDWDPALGLVLAEADRLGLIERVQILRERYTGLDDAAPTEQAVVWPAGVAREPA